MTGTAIAQAIPIGISPILTRIYTPDNFGVFAIFFSITTIFGTIASARYELAVMLPEREEDAINIFALGFIINCTLTLLLTLLVIIFNSNFVELLGNEKIGIWLYFIPISVFFTGFFNLLSFFNNRNKYYKDIASATVVKSIILAFVQLTFSIFKKGAGGLILGQIVSNMFANIRLLKNVFRNKQIVSHISIVNMKIMAIRYKKFPKYSLWGALSNSLSQNLSNILISSFFSLTTLGFYSLISRVLGIPSSLIGNSVGQVFFQEATIEKQKTGLATKTFNKTIKKLITLGLPFFLILYFIIEEVFAFVFGAEWRIAGVYASIIIPLFFFRFVVVTVSNLNNIFELQKLALIWQIILLILSILCFYIADKYQFNFKEFLTLFTIVTSTHYVFLFFILRSVSLKGKL
jgi:O-antigen/teichoic acid export membrane protein